MAEHQAKVISEHQAEGTLRSLPTKVLQWNPIHRGDCEQDGGRLTFYSDGTGTWSCTTLTYHTHSGDVWHARFDVKGSNEAVLFSLGTYDSPRMDDGNPPPRYDWNAQFAFNPDFFDAISTATQYSSC